MNAPARRFAFAAEAQVFVWRFGWVWPLAAAAGALALGVHLALLVPTRIALSTAHTELERVSRQAQPAKTQAPSVTEEQQLQALKEALRPAEPTELIRRLGELARAEQISLVQAEYRQQYHSDTQLIQLHVSQPIKASYPQVKRYLESVLRTTPNVSLDQITVRRENVGQAQLDARLRWSFWLHVPNGTPRNSTVSGGKP